MSHAFSILLNYSYKTLLLISIPFGIAFVAYKRAPGPRRGPKGPLAQRPLGPLVPLAPWTSWAQGPLLGALGPPLGPSGLLGIGRLGARKHGACKLGACKRVGGQARSVKSRYPTKVAKRERKREHRAR